MQAVAMELMDVMFGFIKTFADEDTLAGVMHLEHVLLGFRARPAENFLKNVRDVIHQIHGVIPTNNDVARFVTFTGFLPGSL